MQSRTSNILTTIAIIILIADLMVFSFVSGVYLSAKTESSYITVGCWRKVTETNRAISLRVEERDIEEILDTARHEICHEIHYRLNRETFKDFTKERKENFAEECDPQDYLKVE